MPVTYYFPLDEHHFSEADRELTLTSFLYERHDLITDVKIFGAGSPVTSPTVVLDNVNFVEGLYSRHDTVEDYKRRSMELSRKE